MPQFFNWNPWHGCHKISAGCRNCYVYRADARYDKAANIVTKNSGFYLPVQHARGGGYKVPPGSFVWTCFTSDFLVPDADPWREEAWRMMRVREDCTFQFITKRIDRLAECLPPDWGAGYPNVRIACTVEDQQMADYRLPIYLAAPIQYKSLACEPLLTDIALARYLDETIHVVVVGGESGEEARTCEYDWVLHIREQCMEKNVPFYFKQTGANFVKDGKRYRIRRPLQSVQAHKANIDTGRMYE